LSILILVTAGGAVAEESAATLANRLELVYKAALLRALEDLAVGVPDRYPEIATQRQQARNAAGKLPVLPAVSCR
jgi:hypothetical protein